MQPRGASATCTSLFVGNVHAGRRPSEGLLSLEPGRPGHLPTQNPRTSSAVLLHQSLMVRELGHWLNSWAANTIFMPTSGREE